MDYPWEEFPLAIKEEILKDLACHEQLVSSLIESRIDLGEFSIDTFPGFRLIELLYPGKSLNAIYLAITDPAQTPVYQRKAVCIKVVDLGSLTGRFSASELADCSTAIQREAEILEQLAGIPELQGKVPKLVKSGKIRLGQFETYYLITEYIAGVQPASPEDLRSIEKIESLLEILATIHRAGIIHGDLTPENLLIQADGSWSGNKSHRKENTTANWTIIDFGNAMRPPRWSQRNDGRRPNFAHRLAGSLDEIRYACRPKTSYDVACLALVIRESTQLRFEDSIECSTQTLQDFWNLATDPRPEFRPADADAFLRDLRSIRRGDNTKHATVFFKSVRSAIRRNPRATLLTIAACAVLLFASSYAFYQRQLNQQADALNEQLSLTVDSLLRRNSTMLRQITELTAMERLADAQSRSQIDGLISDSLQTLANSRLNDSTRIAALRLLLDTTDAMLEVEKVESTSECLNQTVQAIQELKGQAIANHLSVEMLSLQAESKQLKIAIEYRRALPLGQPPEVFAKSLVERFLNFEINSGKYFDSDSQRDILRSAENLLRNALYPFRFTDWLHQGTEKVTQRVYEHAVRAIERDKKELAIALAALKTEFAFMIHKGFLLDSWNAISKTQLIEQRGRLLEELKSAQDLLNKIPQDRIPAEEWMQFKDLCSRIPNLRGMSYSQAAEFQACREQLQQAYRDRKTSLDSAPRSLLWLRRTANTAWNLADSYVNESLQLELDFEPVNFDLLRASIPHRREAFELSERWFSLDGTKESQTAFLVNGLRWFYWQLAMDNSDEALRILERTQKVTPLRPLGRDHSIGDEIVLAAAWLHLKSPEDAYYRSLLNKQIDTFHEWVIEQQAASGDPTSNRVERKAIRRMTVLMERQEFVPLKQDPAWQSLLELLRRVNKQSQ
jgi:serine/threonine protein kinase